MSPPLTKRDLLRSRDRGSRGLHQSHSSSPSPPITGNHRKEKMILPCSCLIRTSLPLTIILTISFFTILAAPVSSQATCEDSCGSTPVSSQATCKNSCGSTPVQYPFGTGPGCGSPQFQRYVTCDPQQQALTFTTDTGTYPIQSVDYANQVFYVTDPSMSSCACTTPSPGFGLDWDAPFSFLDGSVFVLLGCSPATTSAQYTNSSGSGGPLCDPGSFPVCSLLYSCPAVGEQMGDPVSTCCVYAPVSLGPSFDIDLKKLQCGAYAGIYSFGGQAGDPRQWKFGIAVKYTFSVENGFPRCCADCERSNGVCGYVAGEMEAFACNCPNGMNTTSDCFFMASYNSGCADCAPRLAMGFMLILSVVFLWTSPWTLH